MVAFQVAFDIEDNATQEFCHNVKAALPPLAEKVATPVADPNAMQIDVFIFSINIDSKTCQNSD